MRVTVRLDGGSNTPNPQENDLSAALNNHPLLRGRVRLTTERHDASGLNPSLAALLVDLSPAALGAFASILLTWLRHRTGSTRLTLRRPDGARLELSAQRVRNLNAAELTTLATQLTEALAGHSQLPGTDEPSTAGQIAAIGEKPEPSKPA
ncbi:hypothetical protein [Actinoplanes sp. NBRC 103695]|uniref:effector-associated constant component EACC1 n=1 Tax=Actinoplanes sp. NBRC 103695 TaxID=3032202 RepID=UPI0024A2208D|nr:hypothetical protein [Actinoplanes sp. NBRC 103695]GLZ01049.1 hypothetical protein Acsp02_83000 [Actinoplanes sp. NBRC 103695]